jgi:hypothetical protein
MVEVLYMSDRQAAAEIAGGYLTERSDLPREEPEAWALKETVLAMMTHGFDRVHSQTWKQPLSINDIVTIRGLACTFGQLCGECGNPGETGCCAGGKAPWLVECDARLYGEVDTSYSAFRDALSAAPAKRARTEKRPFRPPGTMQCDKCRLYFRRVMIHGAWSIEGCTECYATTLCHACGPCPCPTTP